MTDEPQVNEDDLILGDEDDNAEAKIAAFGECKEHPGKPLVDCAECEANKPPPEPPRPMLNPDGTPFINRTEENRKLWRELVDSGEIDPEAYNKAECDNCGRPKSLHIGFGRTPSAWGNCHKGFKPKPEDMGVFYREDGT